MSANFVTPETASAFTSPVIPENETVEKKTVKSCKKKTRRPKPAHMRGEVPLVPGDFLGLPGLCTTAPPEVGDFSILIRAEQTEQPTCSYCRCADEQYMPSNGTRAGKPQMLLDEPRGFRRVRIELTRRNFRCDACGASGLLPLWGVREGQRATDRLVGHVEQASLFRPFAEVALTTGLSRRKVAEVFDRYVRRLDEAVTFEAPRVIGIDGIKIRKKGLFAVVTDLKRRLVLHVWKYSREEKKFDSDRKLTNAFTEWANRRIHDVLRESRGCSAGVLRGKLIYGIWMSRRMRKGADRWGESTLVMARTRRPSDGKPKNGSGGQKPKKPTKLYSIRPNQPSLFKD